MATLRVIRQPTAERDAIRRLLSAADEAFVPPLTDDARARISRPGIEPGPTSIDDYLQACLDRPLLGAFDEGQLVGFASLEPQAGSGPLADYTPTTHVSVLLVDEAYRGEGIATRFYKYLLETPPTELPQSAVSTKTWHTNRGHIAILDSLGFECVHRVKDDREPGVDTVYYARRLR
ncbi:GNAT family N-acetyltransferase [Halohasta litorea]|uniref:GNAT family N-acetyltransferase n=1 Tax=Halohasta litorea TaxID=869891 RepID=A0ABD6D7Z5_9EURY|nr:GNAT family N-acetyltransferase [Halohasta litorea]